MKLWQLRNPKTGENLSDLQPLPENWGPIFGMSGIKDRLGDLSWLGIYDKAWFEVEITDPTPDVKTIVDAQAKYLLEETKEKISLNNNSITKAQWQAWVDYRKKLEEINLQPGYPTEIFWPSQPE